MAARDHTVHNRGVGAVEKSDAGAQLPPPVRRDEKAAYAIAFLLFTAASALTLYFNHSMASGMPMPGNWTMSMMWMPMGNALTSTAVFAAMWLAMMVAMMLPSTLPMLLLYRRVMSFRQANRDGATRRTLTSFWHSSGVATVILGTGYFFIWSLFGAIAYGIGSLIARGAMHWDAFGRTLPVVGGIALCIAGIYQLTPWKSACLAHCRDPLGLVAGHLHAGRFGALRLGVHHGTYCAACCWALMLMQLVLGVMNLGVMVAIAAVIALEKLLPRGDLIAKIVGMLAICSGAVIAIRAI